MKTKPLLHALDTYNAAYFIINAQPMLRYITGFSGSEGVALIARDRIIGFFDTRYTLQVKQECNFDEVIVVTDKTQVLHKVADYLQQQRVCCDAVATTMLQSKQFESFFNVAAYVDTSQFRVVKTEDEITIIKAGIAIADTILEQTLPLIHPGLSENEVVGLLFQHMIKHDIKHFSFNTIVASGVRSAFPHGVASSKIIQKDDIITIDFGIVYQGYCTDMTRTFFIGEHHTALAAMYRVVLEANMRAIEACAPGVTGEFVDAVARQTITKHGYGAYFTHGTGHGLGLDIHEEPYIRPGSQTILQPGMIITIEPGIYIEGLGGIRIEDVVLITEHGAEVLTKSTKYLK